MAPIPLVLDDETKDLVDNLKRREKDLAEFQVPRLRQCSSSLVEQQRLAAELKEDLGSFGQYVEVSEAQQSDTPRLWNFSLETRATSGGYDQEVGEGSRAGSG